MMKLLRRQGCHSHTGLMAIKMFMQKLNSDGKMLEKEKLDTFAQKTAYKNAYAVNKHGLKTIRNHL